VLDHTYTPDGLCIPRNLSMSLLDSDRIRSFAAQVRHSGMHPQEESYLVLDFLSQGKRVWM
jgi:hypothetical protein